jgi:hypothetical protein
MSTFAVETKMGVRDRIKGRDLVSWVKEQAKVHIEKTGEVHPAAFFLGSIGTREIEAYSAVIKGRALDEYVPCDPSGRMAHLLWEQPKESA